jgi:hypothetical protein
MSIGRHIIRHAKRRFASPWLRKVFAGPAVLKTTALCAAASQAARIVRPHVKTSRGRMYVSRTRGADTRVCRVETRLDAFRSCPKSREGLIPHYRRSGKWDDAKSVDASVDAADTSVRATSWLIDFSTTWIKLGQRPQEVRSLNAAGTSAYTTF